MHKVIVKNNGQINELTASDGQNLLELFRKSDISINTPCNGNGTCGKCKVRILSGHLPEASGNEIKVLGPEAIKQGFRLSCGYGVVSGMEIMLEGGSIQAQIVTEGRQREIALSPIVTRENATLGKPDLTSQTGDYERILGDGPEAEVPDMELIRGLPELLRQNDFNISLVKSGSRLLGVEAGTAGKGLYGVAVDIGTTTIAAYLLDLTTGKRISVNSSLNPQKVYGADVISRIKHTLENEEGLAEMQSLIISEINKCIGAMCGEAGISSESIYAVTFVGNTTMMHLLLRVTAKNIAAAPFIPAVTSMLKLKASQLGIDINKAGIACVLPCVSAYIGADTVGAVLSTGIHEQEEMSLLIDIGTNGEIVLGSRNSMYACSSAAGPAFEGANIRNGMGSVKGAINSISLKSGVEFTTIGNASPAGICGTGIVDGIAQLLEAGLIDETGRIDDEWEPASEEQSKLAGNLTDINGMNAFVIDGDIAITQKDVRELQNAKAAIAAGINVLVRQAGISFDDIKNVYLAGGFGTYINIDNALKIGLIPEQLKGKIQSVGNAAGQGAIESLISLDSLSQAVMISKKIKYIELSSSKDFNDFFIDCMMFE